MSTQESAAPQPLRPEILPVEDLAVFPSSLPTPLMPLVGRVEELRRYSTVLADPASRLLTLTGPGGVGKTRLAIALAAAVRARFPHGVTFVPLAEVRESGLLLPAIARALGLPPDEGRTVKLLVDTIGSRDVLLVLDNLEQLTHAAPELAGLLEYCPRLTILATSRVPLAIRGEHEVSLEPLPLPESGATLAAVGSSDAVAFFLQVARKHVSHIELTDENRGVVVEICRRLDGLPLGLELAASQLRLFPPATLLRMLEHRLEVLTEGPRDLPDRQRTLRNTIRWSYDLLDPGDRVQFRQLGVFVGGFTLEAACEVLGLRPGDAVAVVRRVVDHHLVRPILLMEGRFRMLETIREFALEALDEAGERDTLHAAHAAWCLRLAEEAANALTGADQAMWLDRLDAEHDNVRAAMAWGMTNDATRSLRIASSMWRFWVARGYAREGQDWLRRALEAAPDASSGIRAAGVYVAAELSEAVMELPRALDLYFQAQQIYEDLGDAAGMSLCLNGRGVILRMQGKLDEAEALHREAMRRVEESGDRREMAVTFNSLAAVHYYRGESAAAQRAWEQGLDIVREIGDIRSVALLSSNLGAVALQQGDAARAARLHQESLETARRLRDAPSIARTLINLGQALTEVGDLEGAQTHLEDGLDLARDIREEGLQPIALFSLGRIALLSRDYAAAAAGFQESLGLLAALGQLPEVATALESVGCVASALGRHEDAVGFFEVARRIREQTGAAQESEDRLLDEAVAVSYAAIGPERARSLASDVRGLTTEDAITAASGRAERLTVDAGQVPVAAPEGPSRRLARMYGLTRREIEILRYVVDHRSDKEIGDVLFISPRTVGTHVTSIRNKMGVSSRREAARIADEMGLRTRPEG